MPKLGESYSTGKNGEKDTWEYLKQHGFLRPSKEQRNGIKLRFAESGTTINKRGFDVVHKDDLERLPNATPRCLYEVKSCGAKRGKSISEGFKGLGFTLTRAEKENAERLKDSYKFIFVNVASQEHLILGLEQFFDEKFARIYPTWSVFISVNLAQQRAPADAAKPRR